MVQEGEDVVEVAEEAEEATGSRMREKGGLRTQKKVSHPPLTLKECQMKRKVEMKGIKEKWLKTQYTRTSKKNANAYNHNFIINN